MKDLFGKLADGTEIHRWSLENGGTRMKVLSYGGIVQSLEVPDDAGRYANVSLGFADLDDYVERSPFFGALIGRYGNRVGPGGYVLDGVTYTPPANDGANSLHGGPRGFDKAVWEVEPFTDGAVVGLRLAHTSPDGDCYPMIATHDPRLVEIGSSLASRYGRAQGSYEFQMLYGIRPAEQRRLAAAGETVRVYVPYGTEWYGYLMRRLAERPRNLTFFLTSLVKKS